MADKDPERAFAELMATFGSQALAQILNTLEPIKQKHLAEIARLKAEREKLIDENNFYRRNNEEQANINSALGAEYLRLKAERRKFILGEDLPDTEKFLADMKNFRSSHE
jgi:hypothetical protein